jgi:hypothetical protein
MWWDFFLYSFFYFLLLLLRFGLEGRQAAFVLCIPKTARSLGHNCAARSALFFFDTHRSLLGAQRTDITFAMLIQCSRSVWDWGYPTNGRTPARAPE